MCMVAILIHVSNEERTSLKSLSSTLSLTSSHSHVLLHFYRYIWLILFVLDTPQQNWKYTRHDRPISASNSLSHFPLLVSLLAFVIAVVVFPRKTVCVISKPLVYLGGWTREPNDFCNVECERLLQCIDKVCILQKLCSNHRKLSESTNR